MKKAPPSRKRTNVATENHRANRAPARDARPSGVDPAFSTRARMFVLNVEAEGAGVDVLLEMLGKL
jgi:hypothetical protein